MGSQASLAILVPRRTNRLNIVNIRSDFIHKIVEKLLSFINEDLIVGYMLLIDVATNMNNTNTTWINSISTNTIISWQAWLRLAEQIQIQISTKFKIFLKY